jgi:putative phosphoesterase
MRVLVVSDTHLAAATVDRLPPEVWAMADAADAVLHAGDVCEEAVLDALRERAPVHAVLGNNDHALRGRLPEVLQIELDGVRIGLLHDAGLTKGRTTRVQRRFPEADVVVFGHSHAPLVEAIEGGPLLINPGSPTQRRRQPVHTVASLELADGRVAEANLVQVGPLAR